MIKPIKGFPERVLPTVFTEELSYLELLQKVLYKINEVIEDVNTFAQTLTTFVTKQDLEKNRKLSSTGNFTGWLNGRSVWQVLADIADSLSLSKTIIKMINDRQSIGWVIDGGWFPETDPPVLDIDGGIF